MKSKQIYQANYTTHILKIVSTEFQYGKDSLCFNNLGEHLG